MPRVATRMLIGVFVATVLAATLACGGGGGGGGGGITTGLTAGFAPDPVDGAGGTVSMAEGSVVGDAVTVEIRVADTAGIYGAAFDVAYDPDHASFEGWAPGNLLEQDGNTPNYTIVAAKAGTVVVGASRTGNVAGVDAVGGRTLVKLLFRVTRTGTSRVSFESESLTDDRLPPRDIPDLSWYAGSLVAI